jgi:hypothetical protein
VCAAPPALNTAAIVMVRRYQEARCNVRPESQITVVLHADACAAHGSWARVRFCCRGAGRESRFVAVGQLLAVSRKSASGCSAVHGSW